MTSNDQYALNWSNHTSHIRKAFQTLLQRDEFVDVTLSCEGKKIKAHRMVLSACSSYFHDLLQDNPCPHPIIILRDFKYDNIKNIIMFMYNGEVQVPTENFGSFLKTAEILEICGLTGDSQAKDIASAPIPKEEKESEVIMKEKVKPGPASKKLERERRKIAESRKRTNDDEASQHKKKKEKQDSKSETTSNETDEALNLIDAMESSEPESTQKHSNLQELLGGDELYLSKEKNPECECPICAQKFSNMNLLKQHIPFHLGETKCQYCGSAFARRDLLRRHQINVHKINPNASSL